MLNDYFISYLGQPITSLTNVARPRLLCWGTTLMRCSQFLHLVEPLAVIIGWLFALSLSAFAQTPGGNIFGSDQQVGNAIREGIKWGRNLLFLMGIIFVAWAVVNYGTEKPATKQLVAAIGCFAFGGIVALVFSISQGNTVNFDTGFGN